MVSGGKERREGEKKEWEERKECMCRRKRFDSFSKVKIHGKMSGLGHLFFLLSFAITAQNVIKNPSNSE